MMPGRVILILIVLATFARAADPDYSAMSDEQLVDALQSIKDETVGIDSLATVNAFLAEDRPPEFTSGVLGTTMPASYPQMRLLVRRGLQALPVLLRHVDDARPTRLLCLTQQSSRGVSWRRNILRARERPAWDLNCRKMRRPSCPIR